MRIRGRLLGKNAVLVRKYRFIGEKMLNSGFANAVDRAGRAYSLDICSGLDGIKDRRFQSVDIQPVLYDDDSNEYTPDFVGDIQAAFAPPFCTDNEFIAANKQITEIDDSFWMAIQVKHGIEHIPWRFQVSLFKWLYELLDEEGTLFIGTPNLEYIVGVYTENRKKQNRGIMPVYPVSEHTYCKEGVSWHLQQWLWFKVYSGGSPGDNHLCCHDSYSLGSLLHDAGFRKIVMFNGHTLLATAKKVPGGQARSGGDALDLSISSATGDR